MTGLEDTPASALWFMVRLLDACAEDPTASIGYPDRGESCSVLTALAFAGWMYHSAHERHQGSWWLDFHPTSLLRAHEEGVRVLYALRREEENRAG